MEGQDISKQIARKTLRCVIRQQIAIDTIAVSGEFGVNTFQCITLEIFKFDPIVDKTEVNKQLNKRYDYWKKQEGKTYTELEATIKARGGNTIELRQFRFTELERLNTLISEYHKRQLTDEEIKEANQLTQLRLDSFGIEIKS